MKDKVGKVLFLFMCVTMCLIPSVGMFVAKTENTTENRKMAEMPDLINHKEINIEYLEELGVYFEDHFALKNQLVAIDSIIQSKVFGTSNMDNVIVGNDNWLYYKATLDDFLGQNTISGRKAFNIANNLSIIQKSIENKGIKFAVAIAPNKNSLYGEYMPYYYQKKENDINNIKMVGPWFDKLNIPYVDLFEVFENREEILYLKRDSHWNNKGALLAYNTILDSIDFSHESYDTTSATREKTECGDLNRMLYPLWNELEWNYQYQYEQEYTYVTDTKSVEEAWIETANGGKTGSMVMFRDSFGNTLIPFFANAYGKAYFSKTVPFRIDEYIKQCSPDTLIIEKVERNIEEFANEPPIMQGPECEITIDAESVHSDTTIEVVDSEFDTSYIAVKGVIGDIIVNEDTKIFVKITCEGESRIYEAYTVSDEKSDDRYLLYVLKDEYNGRQANIEIISCDEEKYKIIKSHTIDF